MIKRIILVFLLLSMFALPATAYDDVSEYITEEMEELLPEDILEEEGGISYSSLWQVLKQGMGDVLAIAIRNITSVFAVVILSAVFSVLSSSVGSKGIQKALSYLCVGCIAMSVYSVLSSVWTDMTELLDKINTFMVSLTPVTTLLYSMGGNITAAAVNNTGMGIILTVFETICYHGITPMLRICFGFSLISALSGDINLAPIAKFVRRSYTTVIVFVMSSLICILSLQNMLTAPKDSLGIRTVKFAAANSIPIVGSALGEAAATVGVGISAIRGSLGVLAVLAIAIMVLPVIASMWVNKLSFSLMSSICAVFGLSKEEGLLSGAAELMNFALAITLSSSAMFIISISVFAMARVVMGG
ncbi:MAG: hypothetical protein IKT46_05810 [Clostridia bacterium]|nr:hypothetical protein [Clostridia bacterium]